MTNEQPFISFVVTTFNNEKTIIKVLQAIEKQNYQKNKFEIIIVDDNSTDKTQEKILRFKKDFKNMNYPALRKLQAGYPFRRAPFLTAHPRQRRDIRGEKIKFFLKPKNIKRGPAASSNFGIKKAKGKFIASVDADAIITNNWLVTILPKFKNRKVMIVSGMIYTANPENIWAAFAGRELEDRLLRLEEETVDSISPCNTIYRKEIFKEVGLFNENFKYYGQDVEFCYRVRQAGYKILVVKKTGCQHYWKEGLWEWLSQVYGTGYGRLAALSKFPERKTGDPVSDWRLILQVPLTLFFLTVLLSLFINKTKIAEIFSILSFFTLFLIHLPATFRIIKRTKDTRFFLFPIVLILRNLSWVWAFLRYNLNQQLRRIF